MVEALLSTVLVVRNQADRVEEFVEELVGVMEGIVTDYEIVIVDNGSLDETVAHLERIVAKERDVQVYCLPVAVDKDVAVIAGLENAVGDYLVVFDPVRDDPSTIPKLLEAARKGSDIVLALERERAADGGPLYSLLSAVYVAAYRWVTGLNLRVDAPRYRLMSRRVVNYILQHQAAFLLHRILPVSAGFAKDFVKTTPRAATPFHSRSPIARGLDRALGIMVSSSIAPMRLASAASLVAAGLSVIYSGYVILVFVLKESVAPGWVTLSLQTSGLFFLLAIAIAVLAEYVVRISDLASERPLYYIARELRSGSLSREERLNVVRNARRSIELQARESGEGAGSEFPERRE